MRKQPSLTDIARQLNVSTTTVSFILNGKAEENRISAGLAKRVLKFANEIGYVPNHLAKSLRTGKSHILGLLVEDIANPFFANVAGEIEDLANAKGYRIFYCSSKNDLGKTKELITAFEERQVDGYIITPVEGIEQKIKMLTRAKKKLVLFDRYFPNIDTNYVVLDNEAGAYQATNHLLDNNYTKIAFVTTDSEQTQMLGRLEGYKKAMQARGLKPLIKKVQYNERSGPMIDELIKFLQNNRRIEAVFFATNYLGVYGLEAIHQLALAIPSQLAVVSFDDHDLFRLHKPSITVVAQPIQKISTSLIQVLLDAIDDKTNTERQQIVISPELIIRESTTLRH